ncbi:MAG TPA: serine/threonine protein kinase [Chloroflexota bacterium]|nr:serine/threonine protein kinase [Chloroflexota bacterium]
MTTFGPAWVGQTLGGRYKIEAILGRGGMSAVYRAFDPNLNRRVAIKIINQNLTDNPEFIKRFEQEASLIAQLRHPNIIQVHDFNHEGSTYYMVMEYIPGETLSHRLEALKNAGLRLPLADTVRIMTKICSAVDYAHQRRMIHRDLKPANVLLDLLGEPTLTDFGIAKMIGEQQPQLMSAMPLGTAAYMSPEQVRGEEADHRADIYSLGIILYEMLSGDPPFHDESTYQVMIKQVSQPTPDIQAVEMNTPHSLVAIMERALAKEPDGRFQTAGEMSNALNTVGLQLQGPSDTLATRHLDRLGVLWQQARDAYDERAWQECIAKLDELRRNDQDYQHHKVSSLRRDALGQLSKQAERDFNAGQFVDSLAAIAAIRQYDPDYPVNELEFKVRMGMQQTDLRQQLDQLYQEADGLLNVRDYEGALAKWRSIQLQKETLPVTDPMLVEKRAREGACAMLYTAALSALSQHDPQTALNKLARIAEIDPDFPDSERVKMKAEAMIAGPPPVRSHQALIWVGSIVLALLLLIVVGVVWRGMGGGQTAVSPTATTQIANIPATATSAALSADAPTHAPSPAATNTTRPTLTSSPTPATATAAPTTPPTQTITPQSVDRAVAQENVSLFAAPDAASAELAIIEAGEAVWVLARSETGNWLYVSNDNGDRGFASLERLTWAGDVETLRVQQPVFVVAPSVTAVPSTSNLVFNLYQLEGTQTCNGEAWTIKVFMEGQGGTGIYNYYWNDALLVVNTTGSYTFDVRSGGGPVIGTGRVTSGNLSAEKELFLTRPDCP